MVIRFMFCKQLRKKPSNNAHAPRPPRVHWLRGRVYLRRVMGNVMPRVLGWKIFNCVSQHQAEPKLIKAAPAIEVL